jgi:hypothetical protein
LVFLLELLADVLAFAWLGKRPIRTGRIYPANPVLQWQTWDGGNSRLCGNLRVSRDLNADHPGAAARNQEVGGQRRIPACCVTELFVEAKLIVAARKALRSGPDRDT